MSLLFKYNKETYNPNNNEDTYNLLRKLNMTEEKLGRVREEYNRLYKKYLILLEKEKKKVRKRDSRGRFI